MNEQKARDYCRFILESGTWGHGPLQVAEVVKSLLDGGEMPEDARNWLNKEAAE